MQKQAGVSFIAPGAALAQAIRDTLPPGPGCRGNPEPRSQALDGVDATDVGRLHAASGIADTHAVAAPTDQAQASSTATPRTRAGWTDLALVAG